MEINKVYHTNALQLLDEMEDNSVTLTVTDIPYDYVNMPSNGIRNFDKGFADTLDEDLTPLVQQLVRVTKGSIYMFCGPTQFSEIFSVFRDNKLSTRTLIWEKTNPSPANGQHLWLSGVELCVYGKKAGATFNAKCRNTVFRYPVVRGKFHPTQKNMDLISELIKVSSNENDLVFDPFVGSGTTAIAAKKLCRNYIVADINSQCCQITEQRIKEIE